VDQPFPKTPKDYGIDYTDVEFKTHDGIMLSGWLLNEKGKNTIIMTHFGYRANRFGYQTKYQGMIKPYDKEIEFVKVAKRLVDAGYTVLMYDLRNHGKSGKSKLGVGTGGVEESKDVIAAVEFIANHEKKKGQNIGLLSYCMGANSTFYGIGKDPEVFIRSNVKALVAMQPLSNGEFLRAYGFNKRILKHAEKHYKKNTGYSLDHPMLNGIEKVMMPTLLCQGIRDPWTNLDFVKAIFDTIPVEKEINWIDETDHRFDGYNWFGDHPEKMLKHFGSHL
jgi:dienelactone hydrolase